MGEGLKRAVAAAKASRVAAKQQRMDNLRKAQAIVRKGVCPDCGTKLYRNLSLSGWWQCGHYGSPGFQREVGPHCSFQIFYDPSPKEALELNRG